MNEKKKIFITGGSGFIGSCIVKKLVNSGHEVIVFDSFIKYRFSKDRTQVVIETEEKAYERLESIKDKITIIKGDIMNFRDFSNKLDELQPELILHLAGVPLANVCNVDSNIAINNILIGTMNILNVIKDKKYVKRFVYASSSMAYGNFTKIPVDENQIMNPLCNYGTTKLAGEIITRGFSNRYGFEHVIVRPSAVYGPGDTNNRVVQLFAENALKGLPLTVEGASDSKLDFTYIEDIAEGFCLALLHPNAKNETFNMTNGEGRTLQELVDIIKNYVPDIKIIQAPPLPFRPLRGALDISKAKNMLGYKPKYSLEHGIKNYINYLDVERGIECE